MKTFRQVSKNALNEQRANERKFNERIAEEINAVQTYRQRRLIRIRHAPMPYKLTGNGSKQITMQKIEWPCQSTRLTSNMFHGDMPAENGIFLRALRRVRYSEAALPLSFTHADAFSGL